MGGPRRWQRKPVFEPETALRHRPLFWFFQVEHWGKTARWSTFFNRALSTSFQQAFEQLLSRAPGPVFPRARSLYLRKYPLEGIDADAAPFRTFLLEEEILEGSDGVLRIQALAFAVVHWQAEAASSDRYAAYLEQRWQLAPSDLLPALGESWFREGGAFARFSHPAVYERSAPTSLLSS